VPATPKKRVPRKSPAVHAARARRQQKSRAGGGRQPTTSPVTLSLAFIAIALALLLGALLLRGSPTAVAPSPAAEPAAEMPALPSVDAAEASRPAPAESPASPAKPRAQGDLEPASYRPQANPLPKLPALPALPRPKARTIIFIIDDAGYSMSQLEAFLRLPFPLTVAVLPGLPNSAKAARAVRAAGKELILHQPMQAIGGQNPGPGAILLGMGRDEVERIVEENLYTVPGAIGINNHMGSAATADLGIMEAVAAVAKSRGIYYLDSRTTSDSSVPVAARREGIRYWERDVFLDNTPDRASIIRAVEDGKKRSEKDRPAVMIGHVWSAELAQTLTDLYPQLVSEGFSLSTISRFMVQEAAEDDASPRD
jgi:polysaccharide deacetylase 2 family uncharacterized protein YibQ